MDHEPAANLSSVQAAEDPAERAREGGSECAGLYFPITQLGASTNLITNPRRLNDSTARAAYITPRQSTSSLPPPPPSVLLRPPNVSPCNRLCWTPRKFGPWAPVRLGFQPHPNNPPPNFAAPGHGGAAELASLGRARRSPALDESNFTLERAIRVGRLCAS